MIDSLPERINDKIWPEPNSGCWLWSGATSPKGYGVVWWAPGMARVHRLVYVAVNGPIADGLSVLHRCDNPPCCNPDHLFLGTNRDNVDDKVRKGRAAKKLTSDQVLAMRAAYSGGGVSQGRLAAEFGVGQPRVSKIVNRKNWTHV